MSNINDLRQETINRMITDRAVRTAITKQSHFLFFHFYFAHYVKHETAQFQREIFSLTEQDEINNLFIVAFRGSAKSTIITMSYPIWSILGKQKKKFVLILCQTVVQAKQHMINLKRELENNQLLKNDLGPFRSEDEWASSSLVFSELNARITAASSEQSIRGLRHNEHRPDLIIGDDVEDMNSTRTLEGRNKTYQWLTSEVIPAGDQNTRLVIVGNLLHEDSLLMRLKNDIEENKIDGKFVSYPLINEEGEILWNGKYPTQESIENEKKKIGSEPAWQREFLLKIVPDEGQLISQEWIQYYDKLPNKNDAEFRYCATGVDLAISKSAQADYTAMVSGNIYNWDRDVKIYILPNPINSHISFPETVVQIKVLQHSQKGEGYFYIEEVGYQGALIEQLHQEGVRNVEGVKVHGQDKRSRLAMTTHLIKSGKVLFPKEGAEHLIRQLTGFGVEKKDDLADAFAILVIKTITSNHHMPQIYFI